MNNRSIKTDPLKGSGTPLTANSEHINCRQKSISNFCNYLSLSTQEFDNEVAYILVDEYQKKYHRWSYADITNYLFTKQDELVVFEANLGALLEYAHDKTACCQNINEPDYTHALKLETMLDKFWDHSNLAKRQKTLLSISEDDFAERFKKHAEPYTDRLAKELNKELISLVSIFTALSFIVFGGISSLDNIFEEVGAVPIIELIIVGCVWSFCILNLVFSFVYLVSKLTKLPIRMMDDPKATLAQKYPFWVWSNYFILLVLAVFCWLYYVDYSNSGNWLIKLSQEHNFLSALIGVGDIVVVFGVGAWLLRRKK